MEELFKPFRRGRNAVEGRGTGLGLAIARTFARAQGGDVTYRAVADGGGEFVLLFPSASASP
ncbi:MAG: ATP-binding protein [Gemmatimonadales bacterium]